jgi:flagellar FliJ protein
MKKFTFKLDKLLSYKDQVLDNEMMRLSALNEQQKEAESRLAALEARREKASGELREKQARGEVSTAEYQLSFRYDRALKEDAAETKRALAVIAAKIDKQVEVIKNVKLETKSLEIMKESKLAVYNKEALKDEELRIDEYVNTAKAMREAR